MERKSNTKQKLHIKKGDIVQVISGEHKKAKVSQGRVLRVLTDKQRAIVEGVNIVTKHQKSRAANQPGTVVKEEAPIHISNLMVVEGGKPTRVGRRLNENGKLVRFSKKTGEEIKDNN